MEKLFFKAFLFITITLCSSQDIEFMNLYQLFDYLSVNDNFENLNQFVVPSSNDNQHFIGMHLCKYKNGVKSCLKKGKTSYFGYLCENDDVSDNTVFNIASIGKTFAAATVLCLLQDKPEYFPNMLETKLEYYLPFLKLKYKDYKFIQTLNNRNNFEKLTLKHLLQHTTGFGNHNFMEKNNYNGDKMITEDEFCSDGLPDTEFGISKYSNIAYNLIGMILSSITNETYSNLLRKYVINPLNLKQTFTIPELENKIDRIGLKSDNNNVKFAQSYSFYNGTLYYSKKFNWDTTMGGLFSSINDLLIFINNFYRNNGNILFNEQTRAIRDTPVVESDGVSFGVGQMYFNNGWRGHAGGDMGLNGILAYDPITNSSIAFAITSESLTNKLADIVLAKGNLNNIPKNRNDQLYLKKRYEVVEKLRSYNSIRILTTIGRYANSYPNIFYRLYNFGLYSGKKKC